jgi:hypothetical protein
VKNKTPFSPFFYIPVAAMCQLYQPNQMINILVNSDTNPETF